ncbi:unnamed protein product [Schistosoma turkestanicum]|nr:unnamed protein product [Schistosoma turkestanicum]
MCHKCIIQNLRSLPYNDEKFEKETFNQNGETDHGRQHPSLHNYCDDKLDRKLRAQNEEIERVVKDCVNGLAVVGGVVLGAAALFGIGLAVGLGSKKSRRREF